MGYEYRIRPADPAWAAEHREQVAAAIRALPTFAAAPGAGELWLRDPAAGSPWPYDVRLFLEEAAIFVEVSSTSAAFLDDVRALLAWVAAESGGATLADADDPDDVLDLARAFRRA